MTYDKLLDILSRKIAAAGGQSAFARKAGISPQYISEVLRWNKPIGPTLLNALGVEKIITYRRKRDDESMEG